MKKILAVSIVMFAFVASTFGQVTASATASATIVSPIAIARTAHMNFGNVAVSAAAGTVVLAPGGGRSVSGGVTLPAVTGTVTAASFTVSGTPGYTYSIIIPTTDYIISSGGFNMTVNSFTSTPTVAGGGTLDVTGNQTLNVGATLNVTGSQAPGTYTNATGFDVTVNYN